MVVGDSGATAAACVESLCDGVESLCDRVESLCDRTSCFTCRLAGTGLFGTEVHESCDGTSDVLCDGFFRGLGGSRGPGIGGALLVTSELLLNKDVDL